jgi:hypothetical protein
VNSIRSEGRGRVVERISLAPHPGYLCAFGEETTGADQT